MIVKKEIYYPPKGTTRTLHIYLPNEYFYTNEKYPVMYFFDGHNLFYNEDATFGKSWGMKEFLDYYDKKIIIVGMECTHEGEERLEEYSPYRSESGIFNIKKPLGDETMQWIIDIIKPMIDKEFRTWAHREATGIGGSSMGGLMALYGITKYNHIFSKGACISSAIGFCIKDFMNELNNILIHPDTKAFLSWGTQEAYGIQDIYKLDKSSVTYRNNKIIADEFKNQHAFSKLYCQIGGRHCEEDWEKIVGLFMDYLWK